MSTLIAEDVLLLLLDDGSGTFTASDKRRPILAGAVLAELALTGAVEIATERGWRKRARVVVGDRSAVSDPLLVDAVEEIAAKQRSPQDLVNRLGKTVPDRLCTRLVERGLLRREQSRFLGLFPRTRWPAVDSRPKQVTRGTLHRVLLEGQDPDERIALVIAVLAAADVLHKVVDRRPLSRKDLKRRAEEIAAGGWATEAVRKAIQAAQSAVMAGITAAAVAGAAGS